MELETELIKPTPKPVSQFEILTESGVAAIDPTKHFVSNKDESVRLFQNPVLEAMTKVHPAMPIIVFGPVVGFFFHQGVVLNSFWGSVGLFSLGLTFWTIFEYTLHRIVFHFKPKSLFGRKLHFLFHGIHHDYPRDSRRLVMPPSVSVVLSVLVYFMMKVILPVGSVGGFFAGFIFGYIVYDLSHFAIHHVAWKNKWFLMVRNHHLVHHYQASDGNFGVSSPLWDIVIGTLRK